MQADSLSLTYLSQAATWAITHPNKINFDAFIVDTSMQITTTDLHSTQDKLLCGTVEPDAQVRSLSG